MSVSVSMYMYIYTYIHMSMYIIYSKHRLQVFFNVYVNNYYSSAVSENVLENNKSYVK